MRSPRRWLRPLRKSLVLAVVALLCVGGGIAYALSSSSSSHDQNDPSAIASGSAVANVSQSTAGQIPSGYLGLSFEIRGIESYTGTDPHAVNPVFEQLIRNLDPGQRPVLRLGGDSTDWSWYPYRKGAHPLGVRYTIPASWFSVIRSLAEGVDAHLILGVNFEQDSAAVAGAEARAFESKIGSQWIEALALGNEPELYHGLVWFSLHGVKYYGRTASWSFSQYAKNYAQILSAMPKTELAGPDVGGPSWEPFLGSFLTSEPRVKIATIHRYPLKYCTPSEHVSIAQLLSNSSTRGYAAGLIGADPRGPRARCGVPARRDELGLVRRRRRRQQHVRLRAVGARRDVRARARRRRRRQRAHARGSEPAVHVQPIGRPLAGDGRARLLRAARVRAGGACRLEAAEGLGLLERAGPRVGCPRAGRDRAGDPDQHGIGRQRDRRRQDPVVRTTGTVERLAAPSLSSTGHVTLGGQSFAPNTTTGTLSARRRRPRSRSRTAATP